MIPALAERFHPIAPDYPGFDNSDMPDPTKFISTFDETSEIIESCVEKVGFARFGLYVQDYGRPGRFRIVTRRPDGLEWLAVPGQAFRGSAARSSADRSHLPRSAAA